MVRQEFKQIAILRLAEAESLLNQSHYDGCCYLAGYCLEMALKAVICRRMEKDDFFDILKSESVRSFKIHNLGELVILAGLQKKYEDLSTIKLINEHVCNKYISMSKISIEIDINIVARNIKDGKTAVSARVTDLVNDGQKIEIRRWHRDEVSN